MTKLEQAARQALGALEVATTPLAKDRQEVLRAITTLREALSGVQALSAAPEAFLKSVIALCSHRGHSPANIEAWDKDDKWIAGLWRQAESMLAASPTPPVEQQAVSSAVLKAIREANMQLVRTGDDAFMLVPYKVATTEAATPKAGATAEAALGGVYAELPKPSLPRGGFPDLFTEWQMRDFADRTYALRMEQAAPKAAPGDALDEAMRERDDAEDFIGSLLDEVLGHERPEWSSSYGRADALNDVQERMTSLHKPAVDKAWGQFQSAMAAPQPVVAREPLTDAQIAAMMRDTWGCASIAPRHAPEFARAVERAHGIPQKGGS